MAALLKLILLAGFLLLVLALFNKFENSPWGKGLTGELTTNLATRLRLVWWNYRLLNNVTLPTGDGTTQIDHIIVSKFGVFVVETKFMSGWIYGKATDARWTQKFPRSSFQFQNPLRQNYKHVKAVAEVTGLPEDKIKSVVVFMGDAVFKKRMPPNVCRWGGEYIAHIKSHKQPILTTVETRAALDAIRRQRSAPGLATRMNHIKHVNDIKSGKPQPQDGLPEAPSPPAPVPEVLLNPPRCAECGQTMLQRIRFDTPIPGARYWACPGAPVCPEVIPIGTRGWKAEEA